MTIRRPTQKREVSSAGGARKMNRNPQNSVRIGGIGCSGKLISYAVANGRKRKGCRSLVWETFWCGRTKSGDRIREIE